MRRVVAECPNGHLGVFEVQSFSPNHSKCQTCQSKKLVRVMDEEGHRDMPLKQALKFLEREINRRKAPKVSIPETEAQVA